MLSIEQFLRDQTYSGTLNAEELVKPNPSGSGFVRCWASDTPIGMCADLYPATSLFLLATNGMLVPTTRTDAAWTILYQWTLWYDIDTTGTVTVGVIVEDPWVGMGWKYIAYSLTLPSSGEWLTAWAWLGYVDLQLGNIGLSFWWNHNSVYLAPCSGYLVVQSGASPSGSGGSIWVSIGTTAWSQPNDVWGRWFTSSWDSCVLTIPIYNGMYFQIRTNGWGWWLPVPSIQFYPTDASITTTINYISTT